MKQMTLAAAADAACEEALYDSAALRAFVGIDLGREPVPDATTILQFRHLLNSHQLGRAIFDGARRISSSSGPFVCGHGVLSGMLADISRCTRRRPIR